MNYANSAGSVTWGNVTGKPSYYSSNWLTPNSQLSYGANGLNYFNASLAAGSTANQNQTPTADWWHIIRMNHANSSGYYVDLGFCFHQNYAAYRRIASGTSYGWIRFLDSSNYNSYSPTLTGGGASGNWNISISGNAASASKVNSTLTFAAGAFAAKSFNGSAAVTVNVPTATSHISNNSGFITSGETVAKANQLTTARTINGTSFNGTANITTSYWGTARNIYIQDSPASYTGAAISVNGSGNVYLRLPNSIVCGDWFRSTGSTGWYSNTYGGGIYMTDTSYVRVYNGKSFYSPANIVAVGEVTAYSSSDKRLKKNIKPITNSLDIIEKLNPVQFNWNQKAKELNKEKDERNNYGLIAQEVEENLPELIHPIYYKYKSVDYEQLIPILIQSIKDLKKEVDALKNKINNEK